MGPIPIDRIISVSSEEQVKFSLQITIFILSLLIYKYCVINLDP